MWKTFFGAFDKQWHKISYNKEILRTTVATKGCARKNSTYILIKEKNVIFLEKRVNSDNIAVRYYFDTANCESLI